MSDERRWFLVFTPDGAFTDVLAADEADAVAQVEREHRAMRRVYGLPKPRSSARVVESQPEADGPIRKLEGWVIA